MKILMLTWEYPPFIVGGLGVACYGLFKALAEKGVKIYMILPLQEKVFFEISSPYQADHPIAKRLNGEQIELVQIEKFHFLGSAYSYPTTNPQPNISSEPKNPHNKGFISEIPPDVLKRIELLLSQAHDDIFSKVRLYKENVLEICRKLDFDLVHAHDWLAYPAGLFLKGIFKVPLVSHIHATEFDRALGYGHPTIHEIEYLGLNFAERVIAVSNYTANIIKEHYHVPDEKIRVVYNAFSAGMEPKKIKRFKEPVILFLGRLTIQKGPNFFLDFARKIVKEYGKDVRFLVAGAGEMERELILSASSLGMGTKLIFTGFLNRSEVEYALSMSDIFVMPSVSEPFGIVALEAMYFGCALILSKQSGVSEIIENAYKVDHWDVDKMAKITIELLENPEKLKEMQEKARKEVQKFRWLDRAEQVIKIYKELIANN